MRPSQPTHLPVRFDADPRGRDRLVTDGVAVAAAGHVRAPHAVGDWGGRLHGTRHQARAKQIFDTYDVSPEVRSRYERDWLRSVETLGAKWLYAKYAERLTPEQQGLRAEDGSYRVAPRATDDSPRA